jgi:GNAT superfamily N-acetyltransferase
MQLADALATEDRVMAALGERIDEDGYRVFRADAWPDLYSANAMDVFDPGRRTLAELEALFERHFDPGRFHHRGFRFPASEVGARLADQARRAGYDVNCLLYLVAERPAPAPERRPQVELRLVDRPDRWELLRWFLRENNGATYTAEVVDMFHRRARAISEKIGVEWWYAAPPGQHEMLSKLGMFQAGALARLQDVETLEPHRRRGLAAHLLRHAIARALERGAGLVVCADAAYHALALYGRLGFRELGGAFEAVRRPAPAP